MICREDGSNIYIYIDKYTYAYTHTQGEIKKRGSLGHDHLFYRLNIATLFEYISISLSL